MRVKLQRGTTLGPGVLEQRLGTGGNGQVWQVRLPSGDRVAVKFLTREGREARSRFVRESELQTGPLRGFPGLLPVLDAADADAELLWLSMPIAQPLQGAMVGVQKVDDIIGAVADFAVILAALTERGYAHRDIKPGNLYRFQNAWVVGDLGLIAVPEPEGLTIAGRALGPKYFLAPEMMGGRTVADYAAADVYSLAKTLWVLLTGEGTPPPGMHDMSVAQLRVSSYLDHPSALRLDRLIERATAHEPSLRPPMSEMADELRRLITEPPERAIAPTDLTELARELEAAASSVSAYRQQRDRRRADANQLLDQFVTACQPIHEVFRQVEFSSRTGPFHRSEIILDRANNWVVPHREFREGRCMECSLEFETGLPFPRDTAVVILSSGGGVLSDAEGYAVIVAGHVVGQQGTEQEVWSDSRRVPLGSAIAEDAVQELAAELINQTPNALQRLIDEFSSARSWTQWDRGTPGDTPDM